MAVALANEDDKLDEDEDDNLDDKGEIWKKWVYHLINDNQWSSTIC